MARKWREGKEALLHGFNDALRQGQAKGLQYTGMLCE